MKNFLLAALLVLNSVGCVGATVDNAIDSADEHLRLKWSEEWKPALMAEVRSTVTEAKDSVVDEVTSQLHVYEAKLDTIGVKVEDHDTNKDGKLELDETLSLLKDIKEKNDKSPNPLSWWEILAAVGAAYLPLTGAKEMVMKAGSKPHPAPAGK